MHARLTFPELVLAAAIAACADDAAPPEEMVDPPRAECEHLNPSHCLLPYPSSRFLVEDATTATGFRVAIAEQATLVNHAGVRFDPAELARFDGFSPMTSIATVLQGDLDPSNVADDQHIEASLTDDSPTILIDADTGERIAHFAELDEWRLNRGQPRLFYIRPARRLEENHRYVVGIRSLFDTEGAPIEPWPWFRALKREVAEGGELSADAARLRDNLEILGVDPTTILEAWDFRTGTGEPIWRDAIAMRDDALMRAGERGLGCTITSVETDHGEHVARRVHGTITVPLYMDGPDPGARTNRGPDGLPAFNGTFEVPFQVQIPPSVVARVEAGGAPARLLQYGHGQFGSRGEVGTGWLQEYLDERVMVAVATDWIGMSEDDFDVIAAAAQQLGDLAKLTERVQQSMVDNIVLTRAIGGVCSDLPELRAADMPLIGDERYFLGISQGAILGTTLAALSPDIDRFALQVGGIGYSVMMKRSGNFAVYSVLIDSAYQNPIDADLGLVISQFQWDLGEPSTYAPHVLSNPLPGSTPKRLLYIAGTYDSQVPNAASDIAARTMGLSRLTPDPRTVYDVPPITGPADSAYVEYRFPIEGWPPGTRPPSGSTEAHEGVRRLAAVQEQMDRFFQPDGRVEHTCDGPCDPE
jgi:hypothetical protein